MWVRGNEFKVKMRGDTYVVNIDSRTCTCRKWDLTGIPCAHVVSPINFRKNAPENHLDHWYKKETYLKAYTHMLEVVSSFWDETTYDKLLSPLICKKSREDLRK